MLLNRTFVQFFLLISSGTVVPARYGGQKFTLFILYLTIIHRSGGKYPPLSPTLR